MVKQVVVEAMDAVDVYRTESEETGDALAMCEAELEQARAWARCGSGRRRIIGGCLARYAGELGVRFGSERRMRRSGRGCCRRGWQNWRGHWIAGGKGIVAHGKVNLWYN